jgi:hypothetical protein
MVILGERKHCSRSMGREGARESAELTEAARRDAVVFFNYRNKRSNLERPNPCVDTQNPRGGTRLTNSSRTVAKALSVSGSYAL